MISGKDSRPNDKLDQTGREITRASALAEEESSAIVEDAFLFARLRARIAREGELRATVGFWPSFRPISRKAIPAMVVVAAVSLGLSLYRGGNKTASAAFSVDAYLGTNESGMENMVFSERRPLTNEDVLATIINTDERDAGK